MSVRSLAANGRVLHTARRVKELEPIVFSVAPESPSIRLGAKGSARLEEPMETGPSNLACAEFSESMASEQPRLQQASKSGCATSSAGAFVTSTGTKQRASRGFFSATGLAAVLTLLLLVLPPAAASSAAAPGAQDSTVQHTPPSSATLPTPTGVPAKELRKPTSEYTLPHDVYEKAIRYSRIGYTLHFVAMTFDVIVLLLVLQLGIAAKFRDWAERATENRFWQGCLFVLLLFLTLDLLDLPLMLYWHALSLKYAQSVQGYGSWMADWLKGEMVTIVIAIALVQILYLLIRHSARRWWFYFWMIGGAVMVFIFFISPWFIDPLFHKFEPLQYSYPQVADGIERVLHRAGVQIPPERIFLMRASEKTNQLNAYVTGIGASKRVVVWDTMIQKNTPDGVLFVVGHETGHYVLHHIRNGFLFFAALLLAGLYVTYLASEWLIRRYGRPWKIYSSRDWASLAVLLLVLQALIFFCEPVINGFSRMQEHQADVYGLELIHGIVPDSPEVAAHAFQVLGEIDLSDPNPSPFITFWLYDHPPVGDRLVFAHSYDPWSKGQSPKYVK